MSIVNALQISIDQQIKHSSLNAYQVKMFAYIFSKIIDFELEFMLKGTDTEDSFIYKEYA